RVNDSGIAKDLQLARRLQDRGLGAGGGCRYYGRGGRFGVASRGGGGASRFSCDGEDGSLRGLVDRTVRGVGGLLERSGELSRGQRALALDRPRKPAKDLGQDHA